ncbi:MAG: hypothetical protein ACXWDO_00385 [Bacteroidia bacterium]
MKNNTTLFSALLCLLLFAASCRKEDLGPVYEPGEPVFYVKTEMAGKSLELYSGKDDFVAAPRIDRATILTAVISLYTANFTNGTDSFRVGFMAVKPPWVILPVTSKEELERSLEYAQHNPETMFSEQAGVGINWISGKKTYTSPADADLQHGSYFRITKIEDYTPPGADHAMKKVDVKFRCYMQNYDEPGDAFWMENGEASLLLDYETE